MLRVRAAYLMVHLAARAPSVMATLHTSIHLPTRTHGGFPCDQQSKPAAVRRCPPQCSMRECGTIGGLLLFRKVKGDAARWTVHAWVGNQSGR